MKDNSKLIAAMSIDYALGKITTETYIANLQNFSTMFSKMLR